MTLAHELGHYIDYLPENTLARGNILGRLANLKKYMNKWIAGKEKGEGPFTTAELAKFRAEAEKTARALEKKIRMFYDALGWDMPVDKINTLERFF